MSRGGQVVAATIALLEKKQKGHLKLEPRNKPIKSKEKYKEKPKPPPRKTEPIDSSLDDESTLKCSSTDSGKDDNSLLSTSTSSTSSNSDKDCNGEELAAVCCEEDFQWMTRRPEIGAPSAPDKPPEPPGRSRRDAKRDPLPKHSEIKYRKASASLDRSRTRSQTRKERDQKARSSIIQYTSPSRSSYYGACPPPPPIRPDFACQQMYDYRDRHMYANSHGDCRLNPYQKDYYHYYRPFPCECSYSRYMHQPATELEEQLRKLESEKESLALQVSVLTDQVEVQTEKINDLERTVAEQKRQLSNSEDVIQREILSRSSLETQKLELLAVVSELKRHEATLERDNMELRDRLAEERRRNKPPLAPRSHIYPPPGSTPTSMQNLNRTTSPSPSPVTLNHHSPRKSDDINSTPIIHRTGGGELYRSLPRDSGSDLALKRAVVFGKANLTNDHQRSTSVPNLADNEPVIINDYESGGQSVSQESSPSMQTNPPRGIRKIIGKIKRSGSGSLDDIAPDDAFVRGGVRSTAGARLMGNSASSSVRNEIPFVDWTVDYICDWLRDIGLENSIPDARRWVKNGSTLLAALPQEIDKELNIKNTLLRKKLHLALEWYRGSADCLLTSAGKLEPSWVLRWLDDIGLPQYKHGFMGARLDGRMLHKLNLEDVHLLHISSALHVASIKAGILVLRKHDFEPQCLIRRSDPENDGEPTLEKVELWTNHRVMEWLRAVDLAEYAPNLRGSGVHGGLMVHEERFTATLLASLLSIPPEKTLLRRHLSTHFKQLLGTEVIQQKREAESVLGYVPLTTTSKIKPLKKSQFTLKRKKTRNESDDSELICPISTSSSRVDLSGDTSADQGKSPNHVGVSPSRNSTFQTAQRKEQERISDV